MGSVWNSLGVCRDERQKAQVLSEAAAQLCALKGSTEVYQFGPRGGAFYVSDQVRRWRFVWQCGKSVCNYRQELLQVFHSVAFPLLPAVIYPLFPCFRCLMETASASLLQIELSY